MTKNKNTQDETIDLDERKNRRLLLICMVLAVIGIIAGSYLAGGYYTCIGSGGHFLKGWHCANIQTVQAVKTPSGQYVGIANADIIGATTPCTVPDPAEVNNYCKQNGYEMGWVTQLCGRNQVMCYKEDGVANYNHCVNYVI